MNTPLMQATTTDHRWVATGQTVVEDDAAGAARAAVSSAIGGRDTSLVLVFCDVEHTHDVVAGVREVVDDGTVVAGCSSLAQLGSAGPGTGHVVALAFGSAYEVRLEVARECSQDRHGAGEAVAAAAEGLSSEHRLQMMLCDGLTRQQHTIVRGAYARLGAAVPLIGGCAADGLVYERTHQIAGVGRDIEILSDAVIGIGIGADTPFFSLGIEHGWEPIGEPMTVTSSADGVVFELDGRPALDVYLERTGIDRDVAHDPVAFHEEAFAAPLGLSRRGGEDLRVIHNGDLDRNALICLADVPQGGLVWIMRGHPDQLVDAGVDACTTAVERFDGTPAAVLLFDCGARHALLGEERVHEEVDAVNEAVGGLPVVGMYTYGEIARLTGSRGMHHLTCAAIAFG